MRISRRLATAVLFLLVGTLVIEFPTTQAADRPFLDVPVPDTAQEVLYANGHVVLQTLDLVPESSQKRVQSFRCRLFVARAGEYKGRLALDEIVTRAGPGILDVQADGTLVLEDYSSGVFYSWAGDRSRDRFTKRESNLLAPGGVRHYRPLRANENGVLVLDNQANNVNAYYFIPFENAQPHVAERVELILRASRHRDVTPVVGKRWIVWDRQLHDLRNAKPDERCDLVAYDCERKEFRRLPLEDTTRIQQLDGDLLVAIRGMPGAIEYVGFDLATWKQTSLYAGLGSCLRVRDGVGYFLSTTRQNPRMPGVRDRGKLVVVDLRRQASALTEREFDLPASEPFIKANRDGLTLQDAQMTLMPWVVRP